MVDLSRKHLLAFALLFVALFAVLFVGVVEVHSRNLDRHTATHGSPAGLHP